MKKVLILIIYSFFISFLGHSQIIERFVTPQDLPNLIPGYSQVSTINEQSLSFTFTMQPSPPSPVDGDTTTDGNGPMKYGEVLSVNYSTSNGNYTQTSEGKVWTLSIKVLGGCKNIGLTFTSVNFVSATEMYLYNQSKTVLLGPLKAENLNQSNTFTTGACKDSVITIFIIERNSSTFQSTFNITRLVAGFIDLDDLTNARIMGTECMTSVQCFPEKMIYAHAVARFETGGWLGSGMLINNEENNARPFFFNCLPCS